MLFNMYPLTKKEVDDLPFIYKTIVEILEIKKKFVYFFENEDLYLVLDTKACIVFWQNTCFVRECDMANQYIEDLAGTIINHHSHTIFLLDILYVNGEWQTESF